MSDIILDLIFGALLSIIFYEVPLNGSSVVLLED
jgi:hypothetical protein